MGISAIYSIGFDQKCSDYIPVELNNFYSELKVRQAFIDSSIVDVEGQEWQY